MSSSTILLAPRRVVPALSPAAAGAAVRRAEAHHLVMASVALLVLATAVAAATTSDRDWWQLHFSELGTHRDFSGTVFNLGSLSAGTTFVLFATRVRRAFADIRSQLDTVVHARRHASRLLVVLIASFGGHLAIVGLVPLDVSTAVHERAASGMMLSFLGILALVLLSPWTVTRLRLTSVVVATLLVPAIIVFTAGAITLATLEIVGFALIFVWLAVFASTLRRAVAAPREHDLVARKACSTRRERVAPRGVERSRRLAVSVRRVGCAASASPERPGSAPTRRAQAAQPRWHSGRRVLRRRRPSGLRHPGPGTCGPRGARVRPRPGCRGSGARGASAPSRR